MLLVDGDAGAAQALARALPPATRIAASAEDALALLQSWNPDAVVLDLELAGKGAYELAREIRARCGERRPLLIGCAASRQTSDRLMARIAGLHHVLGKPCDARELTALLAALDS